MFSKKKKSHYTTNKEKTIDFAVFPLTLSTTLRIQVIHVHVIKKSHCTRIIHV